MVVTEAVKLAPTAGAILLSQVKGSNEAHTRACLGQRPCFMCRNDWDCREGDPYL